MSAETGDPRLLSATRILGSGLVAVDQNQPVSAELRRFTLLTHLSIGFGTTLTGPLPRATAEVIIAT